MANHPAASVQYGQRNSNVRELQNFLISQGYQIPAGATGYFGNQTKNALTQWQNANGVTGPGIGTHWGPQSKAAAGSSSVAPPATTTPTTPPVTSPVATPPVATPPVVTPPVGAPNNSAEIAKIQADIDDKRALADAMDRFSVEDTEKMMKDNNGNWIPIIDPTNPMYGENMNTTLLPVLEPGTPEYQAAWDNLSTAYYDILQQELTASTEQQQQAAQYQWDQLRDYTQKTLGFQLSGNVLKAWDEIQGLRDQAGGQPGGRGISGSGIEQESIDKYLRNIRLTDKASRATSQSTVDKNKALYYQGYATPTQIKELVDSNPTLAASYGLIPSEETKSKMSYSALKAKYPDMSDNEINSNIASVLDEFGNRRSNLYQQYMTGANLGVDAGIEQPAMYAEYDPKTGKGLGPPIERPIMPGDYGMLDIDAARKQYQEANVSLDNIAATSGAPIIQPEIPPTQTTPIIPVTNPLQTYEGAAGAAANMGTIPSGTTQAPQQPGGLSGTDEAPQYLVDKVNALKEQISQYLSTMAGTGQGGPGEKKLPPYGLAPITRDDGFIGYVNGQIQTFGSQEAAQQAGATGIEQNFQRSIPDLIRIGPGEQKKTLLPGIKTLRQTQGPPSTPRPTPPDLIKIGPGEQKKTLLPGWETLQQTQPRDILFVGSVNGQLQTFPTEEAAQQAGATGIQQNFQYSSGLPFTPRPTPPNLRKTQPLRKDIPKTGPTPAQRDKILKTKTLDIPRNLTAPRNRGFRYSPGPLSITGPSPARRNLMKKNNIGAQQPIRQQRPKLSERSIRKSNIVKKQVGQYLNTMSGI